jgi:hypothetical protein
MHLLLLVNVHQMALFLTILGSFVLTYGTSVSLVKGVGWGSVACCWLV